MRLIMSPAERFSPFWGCKDYPDCGGTLEAILVRNEATGETWYAETEAQRWGRLQDDLDAGYDDTLLREGVPPAEGRLLRTETIIWGGHTKEV